MRPFNASTGYFELPSAHRSRAVTRSLASGLLSMALSLLVGCGAGEEAVAPAPAAGGAEDTTPTPAPAPVPVPAPAPAPAATGAALFAAQGCTGCHGADGKGVTPLTGRRTVAELAAKTATMPPGQTPTCTGDCANAVSQYIYDTFADKTAAPALIRDPLDGLPTGNAQFAALCARLTTRNVNDQVRSAFCGTTRPTITSLAQLQTALGLAFPANPAAGRNNNGDAGNGPAFAISGHSSSLVTRSVSAINPRAILFTPPNGNAIPGFVAMGFVRGDQLVEIIAHDRASGALDFYLARFTQACNAANACTPGDLLTPAVESNWASFQIYDEGDLKNTSLDCTQCHQPGGPATRRMLRMQELADPWNHWFRDNRAGGQALIADYRAAKGNEGYAGIPGALIASSDPALLEDLVRDNGFGNQPNQFNSGNIQNQVNQTAGQPQNNDVPGTSNTWNTIFDRAVLGQAIPVPYHDVKVTESSTLNTMTQAYQGFRAGTLAAGALPDLRNVFKTSRLFEIAGIAARPGLDGAGIVTAMCTQCHNSRLDQTITRARFNVDLAAMSNPAGGLLTAAERNAEIGVAITRLTMPADDVRKMPPESMKTLSAAEVGLVTAYLCAQTTAPIAQCAGR